MEKVSTWLVIELRPEEEELTPNGQRFEDR